MLDTDESYIVTILSHEEDPRTEFELGREDLKRYAHLDTSLAIIYIGSYLIPKIHYFIQYSCSRKNRSAY